MKSNPCFHCQLKNQDKNNPMCMHCDKRINYVHYLERDLKFAMTNPEQKPASLRLSTLSTRVHWSSAVADVY